MTQFRSHLIYLTHIWRSTSFAEFEGFAKGIMLLFPRVGDASAELNQAHVFLSNNMESLAPLCSQDYFKAFFSQQGILQLLRSIFAVEAGAEETPTALALKYIWFLDQHNAHQDYDEDSSS